MPLQRKAAASATQWAYAHGMKFANNSAIAALLRRSSSSSARSPAAHPLGFCARTGRRPSERLGRQHYSSAAPNCRLRNPGALPADAPTREPSSRGPPPPASRAHCKHAKRSRPACAGRLAKGARLTAPVGQQRAGGPRANHSVAPNFASGCSRRRGEGSGFLKPHNIYKSFLRLAAVSL